MNRLMRGLCAALLLACLAAIAPAQAQVAFSSPGLFNELGAGARPAEGDPPTPPISIAPRPPANDPPESRVTPPPPPPADDDRRTPPPPPPADPVLAVYIAAGGATTGPFDAEQLKQKAKNGELTGETQVWMEGMTDWRPAKEVAQLKDILATVPPPAPVTPSFDGVAFLTGTWRSDPETMEMSGVERAQITGTTEYRRDKTYEGYGQVEMTAQGYTQALNFTYNGTYEIQNASETDFVIVLKGSVTYFLDTGPFIESVGGAFPMRIVDRNTLVNDKGTRVHRLR
ncbi:DUF4339 domain-containing protein [Marinovum sp.]|uniref:DUF4339 domain-containing protein n=1 Tax=Marinovum sp. TaxID=2024839 RepID=UPI002B26E1C9|nr:DUF4339 domain-containing protein [Marinovum sp.]